MRIKIYPNLTQQAKVISGFAFEACCCAVQMRLVSKDTPLAEGDVNRDPFIQVRCLPLHPTVHGMAWLFLFLATVMLLQSGYQLSFVINPAFIV